MRRYASKLNAPARLLAAALTVVFLSTVAVAAASAPGVDRESADSLTRRAAGYYPAEPTVQEILDSMGWGLSAIKAPISASQFQVAPGMVVIRVLSRHSGLQEDNSLGWYRIGSPGDTLALLPGIATPADSVVFTLASPDSLGWFISREDGTAWYSDKSLNGDRRSHLKVYPSPQPGEYLLCWEDLAWPSDGDFNDLVVLVRIPSATTQLAGTPKSVGASRQTTGVTTGLSTQNKAGLAVLDSWAAGATSPTSTRISIKLYDTMMICSPGTVCVPFHVTAGCAVSQLWASSPGFVNLLDSSLCVYVDRSSSFYISLVAYDQCGTKDSVRVYFNVTLNQPARVIAPPLIDTLLCKASWICIPIASTGTAPVTISAVSPAIFNASTKTVCYKVNTPGTHRVLMIASNACGPETTVTEIRARFNAAPTLLGIPNDTVKVCQTGPYCFGPVTCNDADGNLASCITWGCPGTYDGQYWCYTPTGEEIVTVVFRAADGCGLAALDTLVVRFGGSIPPNITMHSVTATLCRPDTVCVPFSISNPEGRPLQLSLIGTGTLRIADSVVCRAISAAGTYTVKLVAADNCGKADTAQATITVTTVGSVGPAITMNNVTTTLCRPDTVRVPFSISNPERRPLQLTVAGPGTLRISDSTIGRAISTAGTYTVTLMATDNCGYADTAQATINATAVATLPPSVTMNNVTVKLCRADTVRVPFSISNPEGRPLQYTVIGTGTIRLSDSTIGRAISTAGTYTVKLMVTDNCGYADTAQATINATMNGVPLVTCTTPSSATVCAGTQVCVRYTVSDPDGGNLNVDIDASGTKIIRQAISGSTDSVCLTISQTGTQTVRIITTDSCGAADTCSSAFTMTVNSPPVASVRDTVVSLCSPQQICIPYSCSDPNNNLATCLATGSKAGTANGTTFCFTPDTAGVYRVTVQATDACGLTNQKIAAVTVSYNVAPTIVLSDSAIFNAADKETVCVSYTATDPEGKSLTITNIGGILKTATHQFCVVASAAGVVCGRVVATDPCGKSDTAMLCVVTAPNPTPRPSAPDTIKTRFCGTGDVCVHFSIGPTNCPPLILTGLYGGVVNMSDTTLCLRVYGPGTYLTGIVAKDNCGAETTFVVVQVTANNPPVIVCPQPETYRICRDTTICIMVAFADPDSNFASATVSYGTVTPAFKGLFKVCFPVDTSGWYTSRLIVRDSCGAADTCDLSLRINHNIPPQIRLPNDTTVFLCFPRELCFPASCFDPDYNIVSCGPASLGDAHWDGSTLCFTPIVAGDYQWVFHAMDACGNAATDTFRVTIKMNRAPTITISPSAHFTQCSPETVCVPFQVSDPDGDSLNVSADHGVIRNGMLCVSRTTSGTDCVRLIVRDPCCFADTSSICVTFDINSPPTVVAPPDFARNVCGLGSVCFKIQITDDRPKWTAAVLPGGTFNPADTSVCFYADTAGVYRLIVVSTDSCGLTGRDTVNVTARFNRPPVVTAPATKAVTACSPGTVCVGGVVTSDPDGNMKRVYLSSGQGTLDPATGIICFTANAAGTFCFEITAEDSCGATASKSMCVSVSMNVRPTVSINGLPTTALYLRPTQICFGVTASDPNANQLFDLKMIEGGGVFTRQISHTPISTTHCFLADTTGCYRFIFEAADSCGLVARDTSTICVRIEPPDSLFQVCIDTVYSLNGRNATVKIRALRVMEMGGYNFLICYDPTVLKFSSVQADTALAQWEYFTYRTGSSTGCLPCGSGSLRLIGIADMNNGSAHPPEGAYLPKGPMHAITFYVTADRTFINQCGYIQFCSYTCSDNTISSRSGDTLFTSFTGVPDSCFEGPKNAPIRQILFCDGSICIVPPPDDRGDINLNGVANEVADAVLFSNFFIYGSKVWDPVYKENQILATDVNCDGLVLTISDLVRLIRIITGDDIMQGCPGGPAKIAVTPSHQAAIRAEKQDGRLLVWVSSDADLGGVFVRISTKSGKLGQVAWAEDLGGLTAFQNNEAGELRALLIAKRSGVKLASGTHLLFSVPCDGAGAWKIEEAQAATSLGDIAAIELAATGQGVPSTFELEQNYPNPFNATTQIRFSLGVASKWELAIYNVLGQPVRRFTGENEAGSVTVEWNATTEEGYDVASGLYFARLKAREYTATKKMVLIK